jgi:hypothetical protein
MHPVPNPPSDKGDAEAMARYQRAMDEREERIGFSIYLLAMPDLEPPVGWQIPRGLLYSGVRPREGEFGLLIDYIEHGLIASGGDIDAIMAVAYGHSISEGEVEAVEATFPAGGGGDAVAEPTA